MNKFYIAAICVAIILCIVAAQALITPSEKFDTYNNHWRGAQQIYGMMAGQPMALRDAELLAQYNWSHRAPDGSQLYDAYYEGRILDEAASDIFMDGAAQTNPAATSNVPAGDAGIADANNSMMINAKFSLADTLDFYPAMAENPWGWGYKEPISQKN